ncbi:head decoration protein [Wolbachia endosymbiont (group E) of Neria commutata]|uniref:head decoration protein n=1 Tax=Wolbachia endosymbiont (group E) of Neria commutata TaxID=3066149 RepID=UPI003132D43B
MTCITEPNNLGDLLKYEVSNLYLREQIIIAKGQNLSLGAVIAKKTDDGFIKALNPAGTDGTQTAIGVITSDVNSKDADTKAVIITRIALLAGHAVVWPANITEEQKTAAIKQLEERRIIVRKAV